MQSWGPLVFGHADPETVEAVREAALDGTSFGAPTERELELAEEIVAAVPSVERVRLVSSGTEAGMSALRLARGFTRRDRVITFAGCYHGHADPFLARAGSGLATLGIASSPGRAVAAWSRDTIVCEYNDVDGVAAAVERYGEGLAAIFVEPVAGNMGCVPPAPGFLEALRMLCDASGALLVFDEVITGFRVARGGAQARFGVTPDLTVLGKIVGGGLPLAAFGGRAEVMEHLAPSGAVYQAGTLSGNPLATAAGVSVLRRLRDPASTTSSNAARRASPTVSRRSAACSASARCSPSSPDATSRSSGSTRARHRCVCRAVPRPLRARRVPRAEPVRVSVPFTRPHRRGDRPDDRRNFVLLRRPKSLVDLWTRIAPSGLRRARCGRRRYAERRARARCHLFSPLVPDHLGLGFETVYEAYLVHYGRPRLFDPPEPDAGVLLGDYLYAHGLVRIAEAGGVPAVAALADLIARCAAERADGRPDDGAAWVDAARALGGSPGDDAVVHALALHSARVAP